ncbi:XRE family transcriptional regulator [Polaromonas sp. JS666]|uniref:XRE family transcriptional regulator n=1 Tax=Polaromonas sp. (strain JS666 / ATCC BAA-500) TaxID=296591 RepID=UPI001E3A3749|nr:XRE family transcriptional regulator [Polaromonas sp. JS666]
MKNNNNHTILCVSIIKSCAIGLYWSKTMTYDEFLAELGKAGLSVRAFADLIGMNPNSVSNYASGGEVPRHLAVIAVLLAEMNVRGIAFQPAIGRVSANRKKPRGRGRRGRFGGDKQEQLELES